MPHPRPKHYCAATHRAVANADLGAWDPSGPAAFDPAAPAREPRHEPAASEVFQHFFGGGAGRIESPA